jgi:glycosyltransferase involved in cell wall biosynthesis
VKILQVIPAFVPAYGYGGALKVCYEISKELASRGHEITVVTTDAFDINKRIQILEEEIDSIKVIRFKNLSNKLAKKYSGFLPLGYYKWVKKNITKFNLVYCHDTLTYPNLVTCFFCKKNNIPYYIQPHGNFSSTRINSRFKIIKNILLFFFKNIIDNASKIVAVTKNECEEIIEINHELERKVIIVPNAIRTEEFKNINKINLHAKYNIINENKIIGFIGRIQHLKGIDISLNILNLLKNKLKFTFLIIGPDDGEKKNLEKQIQDLGLQDNVIFAGILSGVEKLETIKSCDMFLLTSRSEGLPISVLEVAALGVPQVISDNCNVPELKIYDAGFVFPIDVSIPYLDAIYNILINEKLHEKLEVNSFLMINNVFEIKNTCNRIEESILKTITEEYNS